MAGQRVLSLNFSFDTSTWSGNEMQDYDDFPMKNTEDNIKKRAVTILSDEAMFQMEVLKHLSTYFLIREKQK